MITGCLQQVFSPHTHRLRLVLSTVKSAQSVKLTLQLPRQVLRAVQTELRPLVYAQGMAALTCQEGLGQMLRNILQWLHCAKVCLFFKREGKLSVDELMKEKESPVNAVRVLGSFVCSVCQISALCLLLWFRYRSGL